MKESEELERRLRIIENTVLEILERLKAQSRRKGTQLNEKWMTRDQLRDQFKISYPTINNLEKQGQIKGYRMGRRVFFLRSEIEQQLKERVRT